MKRCSLRSALNETEVSESTKRVNSVHVLINVDWVWAIPTHFPRFSMALQIKVQDDLVAILSPITVANLVSAFHRNKSWKEMARQSSRPD